MPKLLSGSTLRTGGSGDFINLASAQPQLPPSDTTATGFTLVTDSLLRTSYRSSLGFIEFNTATIYSSLPEGTIRIMATGSTFLSVSTMTGTLVVGGGVGIGGNLHVARDIVVNGLTIGRGYEGLNNIVIRGAAAAQVDTFNNGQESIAIGYDALLGLSTSYKNIAIGRYALSSGTNLSNSVAIGDSALKNIGSIATLPLASITGATKGLPVILTAINHNISSGTLVTISGVLGMIELNSGNYYVAPPTSDSLALYYDINLTSPVNGTEYTTYIGLGTVSRILEKNNNVGIGTSAGRSLIDGEQNFLLGDSAAVNLTTGTGNLFIGHSVADNIVSGDYNISIGGDNLVDGLNNQVNIGSVFYYNGSGRLQLNSDTEAGVGSPAATSQFIGNITTATTTNPVVLTIPSHGLISGDLITVTSVVGMTEINAQSFYVRSTSTNKVSLYTDIGLSVPVDGTGYTAYASGGVVYQTKLVGGLVVIGGLGVTDNSIMNGSVAITDTTESTSTVIGALTVAGGVGISKNLNVGRALTVSGSGNITLTPQGADVLIHPSLGGTVVINASATGSIDNMGIGLTTAKDANFVNVDILSTATSTSTTTGALTVAGGVGVQGSIYSADGNPYENNLLYTPKITISDGVPPANPRVGDAWIDGLTAAYLIYIADGSDTFWLQIGAV